MTNMEQLIRTLILLWSLVLTLGDETVTCPFSNECVLPCRSTYQEIIHWYNDDRNVHSFFNGATQLKYQDPAYKGRTALFNDQIPKGNISLILYRVKIQDGGRYKCYTAVSSDSKETFVNVKIKAPIQSVDIKMTDNGITCTTKGIYPKPTTSWNIDGDSKEDVQKDDQGLISLYSTLKIQPMLNTTKYTCSFSFNDGTPKYKASLAEDKNEIDSGKDIEVKCPDSQGETGYFSLTLMLNGTEFLHYNSESTLPINKKWKDTDVEVTQEGRITLHNLDSAKLAGIYSCERTTAHSKQIMQTLVQIKPGDSIWVGVGIGAAVFVIVGVISAVICIKRKKKNTASIQNYKYHVTQRESETNAQTPTQNQTNQLK